MMSLSMDTTTKTFSSTSFACSVELLGASPARFSEVDKGWWMDIDESVVQRFNVLITRRPYRGRWVSCRRGAVMYRLGMITECVSAQGLVWCWKKHILTTWTHQMCHYFRCNWVPTVDVSTRQTLINLYLVYVTLDLDLYTDLYTDKLRGKKLCHAVTAAADTLPQWDATLKWRISTSVRN